MNMLSEREGNSRMQSLDSREEHLGGHSVCRLIGQFPGRKDIDASLHQTSSYLLSGAYYMTTEQQNIGEKVVVVSNGQPPHEMVGQVEGLPGGAAAERQIDTWDYHGGPGT